MAPAMLLARAGPLSSRWLLPAAGSGLLEAAGAASSLAPAAALGFLSCRARRGCLWVAPGASRGHFSSLALSRDLARVSYPFYFFGPVRSAAGPGLGLGTPAQAWLLLSSVLQAASLHNWLCKNAAKITLRNRINQPAHALKQQPLSYRYCSRLKAPLISTARTAWATPSSKRRRSLRRREASRPRTAPSST